MNDALEVAKRRFFEGVAHHEARRFEAAAAAFEESLRLVPGRPSTLANLGASRLALGRPAEALAVLEQALAVAADDLDAWSHRGMALAMLGRHAESLASHERSIAADPARAPDHFGRGNALALLGRHAEALAAFDAAVALDPAHAEAWTRRGGLLRDAGRHDEAARSFENALGRGGDEATNRYYLAGVRGTGAPPAPPRAYVEGLFDEYAAEFGPHLVEALDYRAPERLAQGVAAIAGARGYTAGLDLGCGSGLCGPVLRPWVGVLDGVDLSAGMLEQARGLGVYRHLAHADLVEHLMATGERYDLVVAADVFIYVGALEAVFAGVARVLEPGGPFAFTLETPPAGAAGDGFCLRPSLRYAHSRRYVERLAAANGFALERLDEAPLRNDQGRPIMGLYVYLRAA